MAVWLQKLQMFALLWSHLLGLAVYYWLKSMLEVFV